MFNKYKFFYDDDVLQMRVTQLKRYCSPGFVMEIKELCAGEVISLPYNAVGL